MPLKIPGTNDKDLTLMTGYHVIDMYLTYLHLQASLRYFVWKTPPSQAVSYYDLANEGQGVVGRLLVFWLLWQM